MSFSLIVNADDFNYSPGVSRGILRAHDLGIVTSTTVLINLPLEKTWISELKRRRNLGVGLHLNITFGPPVSDPEEVASLVNGHGVFFRRGEIEMAALKASHLKREFERQLERFHSLLSRHPTHLDTHHHLHEELGVFEVLSELAIQNRLPIRLSRHVKREVRHRFQKRDIPLTDSLLGNPARPRPWGQNELLQVLRSVRSGVHEIYCHPGYADETLRSVSSFADGREEELSLFTSPALKREIKRREIRLIHYGLLVGESLSCTS